LVLDGLILCLERTLGLLVQVVDQLLLDVLDGLVDALLDGFRLQADGADAEGVLLVHDLGLDLVELGEFLLVLLELGVDLLGEVVDVVLRLGLVVALELGELADGAAEAVLSALDAAG